MIQSLKYNESLRLVTPIRIDVIQAEFLATHRVVRKAPSTEPSTPGAAHVSLTPSCARGIPIFCPVREVRLEAAAVEANETTYPLSSPMSNISKSSTLP
jgi:hypothetical protein